MTIIRTANPGLLRSTKGFGKSALAFHFPNMIWSKRHATANPRTILTDIDAYRQTSALKAALELEVFTAMAQVASRPSLSPIGPRLGKRNAGSLRLFVIQQFLTEDRSHYGLAPDTAMFLDKH